MAAAAGVEVGALDAWGALNEYPPQTRTPLTRQIPIAEPILPGKYDDICPPLIFLSRLIQNLTLRLHRVIHPIDKKLTVGDEREINRGLNFAKQQDERAVGQR